MEAKIRESVLLCSLESVCSALFTSKFLFCSVHFNGLLTFFTATTTPAASSTRASTGAIRKLALNSRTNNTLSFCEPTIELSDTSQKALGEAAMGVMSVHSSRARAWEDTCPAVLMAVGSHANGGW